MEIVILGSGSAYGIPMVGGFSSGADINDPKNIRRRTSAFLKTPGGNILIDVSPDIREQTLCNNVRDIDNILITHGHADHIAGLWEIQRYSHNAGKKMGIYLSASTMEFVRAMFGFMFANTSNESRSGSLNWHIIEEEKPFECCGIEVIPLDFPHEGINKKVVTTGYLFGKTLYSTDISGILEKNEKHLNNLDCWIIDCNNGEAQRPNGHLALPQIKELKERFNPKKVYLTHIQDNIDFKTFSSILPENVTLVYDGMVITA